MNLTEFRIDHVFYSVDTTDNEGEWHTYNIPENYKPSHGFVGVEQIK